MNLDFKDEQELTGHLRGILAQSPNDPNPSISLANMDRAARSYIEDPYLAREYVQSFLTKKSGDEGKKLDQAYRDFCTGPTPTPDQKVKVEPFASRTGHDWLSQRQANLAAAFAKPGQEVTFDDHQKAAVQARNELAPRHKDLLAHNPTAFADLSYTEVAAGASQQIKMAAMGAGTVADQIHNRITAYQAKHGVDFATANRAVLDELRESDPYLLSVYVERPSQPMIETVSSQF